MVLEVAGSMLVGIIIFELLRKKYSQCNEWIFRYAGGYFKEKEKVGLTGMPYFVGGVLLTVALFSQPVAITALCFLTFGDVSAAIVGKKCGTIKICGPKSLQGSLAFFVVVSIVGFAIKTYLFPHYLTASSILIGAFIATLTELLPGSLDDNLTVPVITGLALHLLR